MKRSVSGIRGIFGPDLSLNHIIEYANSFARLVESGQCVTARDTRPSGCVIQEAAAAALLQSGIDVLSLEIAPTPVAFREARRYGAGLVVSASHNPLEWNGLKMIIDGRGIGEAGLETVVTKQETRLGSAGEQKYVESTYVEDARRLVGTAAGRPRILVDAGGGAAAGTAPRLLSEIGCEVKVINETLAGSSRGPDPTADVLEDLARHSSRHDLGLAFDLDGDRLVVVKDGKKQTPDATLGLGVAKAMAMGHRRFVFSIDTSVAVERFVTDGGGRVTRSKVGESNVVDAIIKTESDAGGEGSSGGFILPEFNYCRDGILTGGLVASMLHEPQLMEVLEIMHEYHQLRYKVPANSAAHGRIIEEVGRMMQKEFSEVVTIDGVKGIADEDSWVLVRGSNTEDAVRISAESNDPARVGELADRAVELVDRCHGGAR